MPYLTAISLIFVPDNVLKYITACIPEGLLGPGFRLQKPAVQAGAAHLTGTSRLTGRPL